MKTNFLFILIITITSSTIYAGTDLIFKSTFEQPVTQMIKLNDTGITWAGEYPSGNNVDCTSTTTSSQDCNTGRDVTDNDPTDGHAGFSFTKLDASGTPLVDQSVNYFITPWACVRDNFTGLVWEVKTTDGSIHDASNTYRWGGVTHQGSNFGTYYNDWDTLVNGSNSEALCGFNNWRVPNSSELMNIFDNSRVNPAIDINYFPNTNSPSFWSSSPLASNANNARTIYFADGFSYFSARNNDQGVRLVRSEQ